MNRIHCNRKRNPFKGFHSKRLRWFEQTKRVTKTVPDRFKSRRKYCRLNWVWVEDRRDGQPWTWWRNWKILFFFIKKRKRPMVSNHSNVWIVQSVTSWSKSVKKWLKSEYNHKVRPETERLRFGISRSVKASSGGQSLLVSVDADRVSACCSVRYWPKLDRVSWTELSIFPAL